MARGDPPSPAVPPPVLQPVSEGVRPQPSPSPVPAPPQSDSEHSMQTPRSVQCSGGRSEGRRIIMRKLVEWPVVARTPRRSLVR